MSIALIEPIIVQDIFVSGVIPEDLGDGTMRFTGYVRQRAFECDGIDYVVVNRVIRPVPSVVASMQATMKALGLACCGAERLRVAH
ncbi:hypothetical protein [Mesorhizobium sp. ESP-6-2]|uniref:hypothetical protein n=1 Tax=Mesorhizobium sp. ESP-6-2 TaxID=2876625 RepID=UPI001CCF61F4|nr:hypothetical protein [Mesorhizobium sp. ESP-6-2]MBZ9807665.1 hypothetical protein [Mesorhizobium sp. ESP-6-2]